MTNDEREQRLHAILHDYLQARDRGETPDRQQILDAHPDLRDELAAYFADASRLDQLARSLHTASYRDGASKTFVAPTAAKLKDAFPNLEILELLGQGGMGAVYKARHKALDRFVAVKILPGESGPAFAERFTREARALAKLSHPHIVGVHDFGQTASGLFYFVMEFIDGITLRQALRTGLTPEQALAIVPQICDALQFAHDEGIVHRDIKPENVLLDRKGRVKIADFGLAKLLGAADTDSRLTGTNQVMGTPRYMAPEQMEGAKVVDHRADIYSLGVVFYELLTGELPMGRFAPPSKKVHIDVRLDEVVLRALEKEPEQRWQQASDVKTEVEAIGKSPASGMAQPQPIDSVPIHKAVRGPALAMIVCASLGSAVCLAGAMVTGVFLLAGNTGPNSEPVVRAIFVGSLLGMSLRIATIYGAIALLSLRSRGWALTSSVLMLLPTDPLALVGMPLGLWALLTLLRDDVTADFDKQAIRMPSDSATPRTPFLGRMALVALGVAVLLPVFLQGAGVSAYAVGQTLRIALIVPMALGLLSIRHALGRISLIGAVIVLGCFSAVQIYMHQAAVPIQSPLFGDSGFLEGANGPMLGPVIEAKLGIPAHQFAEANAIFQRYYNEYTALERRHTKQTRDAAGHIHITIEPFADEMYALMKRLHAELSGIVDESRAPPLPAKGKVHTSLRLFRQAGEGKVQVELWKDAGGQYCFKGRVAWLDEGEGEVMNCGPTIDALPREYRLYWSEGN